MMKDRRPVTLEGMKMSIFSFEHMGLIILSFSEEDQATPGSHSYGFYQAQSSDNGENISTGQRRRLSYKRNHVLNAQNSIEHVESVLGASGATRKGSSSGRSSRKH